MASILKAGLSKISGSTDTPDEDNPTDKYLLKVTAGTTYGNSTRHAVTVNGKDCVVGDNCRVSVRIREFQGLPNKSVPESPYFSDSEHSKDTYSIAFSWAPPEDVSAEDLVWGIELVNPIGDRIPKKFITTAFEIVKKFVDPSLDCDPYSNKPWVNGAILCGSAMTFQIGSKQKLAPVANVLSEGAAGDGKSTRQKYSIPDDEAKRRKFFSDDENRKGFTFEKGRCYQFDFHNGYIDWKNYALKLPGFSLSVLKWIDDRTHTVRFAMKNRRTGQQYLVVTFRLMFGEQLEGALKASDSKPQNEQRTTKAEPQKKDAASNASVAAGDHKKVREEGSKPSPTPKSTPTGREAHSNPKEQPTRGSKQDQHAPQPGHDKHRRPTKSDRSQREPQADSPEHQHSTNSNADQIESQDTHLYQNRNQDGSELDFQEHFQPKQDGHQHQSIYQQATSSEGNDEPREETGREQIDDQLATSTHNQLYLSTDRHKAANPAQAKEYLDDAKQSEEALPLRNEYRNSIEESLCNTSSVDGRNKPTNVLELEERESCNPGRRL